MKKNIQKSLNIKLLLEFGDLDIRGIAWQNEMLAADDYFSKVDQFVDSAPQLKEVLLSVSKLEDDFRALKELESKLGVTERTVNFSADTKKLHELEGIKKILTEIGYDKLNFEIDSTCNAIRSGDLRLAKMMANEVFVKFSMLLDRVEDSYSLKKLTVSRSFSEVASAPGRKISLKEMLDSLDYEEANRKLRVLAVDDVTVVLNTIVSVLSPYYEVFALKDSSQVEKFLTHTTPELFLLDIEMNGVNGFDLVPLIRQFEKHKDTPIIFLTGNASFNNLKDAISLGARDFITKPVNKDILLEKIEKNIVRRKAY